MSAKRDAVLMVVIVLVFGLFVIFMAWQVRELQHEIARMDRETARALEELREALGESNQTCERASNKLLERSFMDQEAGRIDQETIWTLQEASRIDQETIRGLRETSQIDRETIRVLLEAAGK